MNPTACLNIKITYPSELPVSQGIDELKTLIQNNAVVIVCGATGSGKTTQLPKLCLELGRGQTGFIGHTQPRRLAAMTVAQRIADELNTALGDVVGYQVRFNEKITANTAIKVMTDGILLAEIQNDPDLRRYDTLIIDEAHERSLNIDCLLGYLKPLLKRRRDLKIIITSATIDANRFAQHFQDQGIPAPIINIEGRTYPIEIRYHSFEKCNNSINNNIIEDNNINNNNNNNNNNKNNKDINNNDNHYNLTEHICLVLDELYIDSKKQTGCTDILIFLAGEREIKEVETGLKKHYKHNRYYQPEILPLYSRLSVSEQKIVFNKHKDNHNKQRIILSTNVAETSVTVPDIRYVIDTGTARLKRYNYRNKIEQLHIEPISQAAANQRAGRCGRVSHGICIRLYNEVDFNHRPAFTEPEILRSSLAGVILKMTALGLTHHQKNIKIYNNNSNNINNNTNYNPLNTFDFLDPPKPKAIADGYALLQELGALNEDNTLTAIGKQLSHLPIDPRLGRMVLAASNTGALNEALIIVSALSCNDPKERPADKLAQADLAHQSFKDDKSEFVSLLKLWAWYDTTRTTQSIHKTFSTCKDHFLSGLRMREWADVYAQLLDMAKGLHLRFNEKPAEYTPLHTALLTGLLGNIGFKSADDSVWSGARGIKFIPHPSTSLSKKPNAWLMAGTLTDTTRLYAKTIAMIDATMIESVAKHLIVKTYSDPQWNAKQGQTTAFERGSLYGIPIYHGRRVGYSKIDSVVARETLIRGGLVAQELNTSLPFYAHNLNLIERIEHLEHQSRRPDLMVDDELLFAFYDTYLPKDITNQAELTLWWNTTHTAYKTLKPTQGALTAIQSSQLLYLSETDLLKRSVQGITVESYPKTLTMTGFSLPLNLDYRFEVGSPRDGATLTVPLIALNQIDPIVCEWLVPGMLKDKVQHLLKTLPPKIRHRCQPIAETATAFIDGLNDININNDKKQPLLSVLISFLRETLHLPVVIKTDDFQIDKLPAHCFMNYQVIDEHSRLLDLGRNLSQLKATLGKQAQSQFKQLVDNQIQHQQNVSTINNTNLNHINTNNNTNNKNLITTWAFNPWNDIVELKQGNDTLIGFAGLKDHHTGVILEVFDDELIAQKHHLIGVRRLILLQLKEQIKSLEKLLSTSLQTPVVQAHTIKLPVTSTESLIQTLIASSLDNIISLQGIPKSTDDFNELLRISKAKVNLLTQERAKRFQEIVTQASITYKKMSALKTNSSRHSAYLSCYNNVFLHYERLFNPQFLNESFERLGHYPRYLQGYALRCDKVMNDPSRDVRLLTELMPLWTKYQKISLNSQYQTHIDENLQHIRWLLEELHVGLFAQELRTPSPISLKRVEKAFDMFNNQ